MTEKEKEMEFTKRERAIALVAAVRSRLSLFAALKEAGAIDQKNKAYMHMTDMERLIDACISPKIADAVTTMLDEEMIKRIPYAGIVNSSEDLWKFFEEK